MKVSADGHGVLSHAGVGMIREVADLTGLSDQVTALLADTYRGQWSYTPGAVFADLVAAVADRADCVDIAAPKQAAAVALYSAQSPRPPRCGGDRSADRRQPPATDPRRRSGGGAGSGLGFANEWLW